VPLQCEFFALEGLSQLLKTVEQVKTALQSGLTIHGIVLTMFDARTISPASVADVRSFMARRCDARSSAQRAHLRGAVTRKPVLPLRSQMRSAAKPMCALHRKSSSASAICARLKFVVGLVE